MAGGEPVTPAQRAVVLGSRLDALLAAGDLAGLLDLVRTEFAERADAGDLSEVAALVSALPREALAARPQALLELARACDAEARIRLRARLLQRAADVGTGGSFELALEAEHLTDLARDAGGAEVRVLAEALLERIDVAADGSELAREARVRSSYAAARVLAWAGDPLSVATAEDFLTAAAGGARELGRVEWRAQALQTLGFSVHFYRGEEVLALERLREAIDTLPPGHPRRSGLGTFVAEVLVRSHLVDDAWAVLEQVRDEAAATGDQRSLGYAAWLSAMAAAEQGDRLATMHWLAEAARHPGDWYEHLTGMEFLADAAVCAERVGESRAADDYLHQALARAEAAGLPESAWFALGVIHARRGEPQVAISSLSGLLGEDWLPHRDRWVVWLYLALARWRDGDSEEAARDAERAFASATALVGTGRAAATREDLPGLLLRLEPDAVSRLAPLAAARGSRVAAAVQPARTGVELFGGLSVRVGGAAAAVPPGRVAQLVMILALDGHPVPVDVVLDELWPDAAPEVARRRLRNVLTRIRAACGELIVRQGDALALREGTTVDVAEFELAADRVRPAPPADRPALAAAALALHRGPLLPEAAYAPRVVRRRDQLDRRCATLLEIVASDAERAGDLDATVAALSRLADLEPYDGEVPRRIAVLLRAAGRTQQATAWQRRSEETGTD